jgi:hypothetical protein
MCWSTLEEAITYKIYSNSDGTIRYKWIVDKNKLGHFSRVLANVINEYEATYKKINNVNLDPSEWKSGFPFSSGAQLGYGTSIVSIYVLLNLLLLNSEKLNATTFFSGMCWLYNVCGGHHDGHHPPHLSEQFVEIRDKLFVGCRGGYSYDYNAKLNVIDKELVSKIKQYLKHIFECLIWIKRSKYHGLVSENGIHNTMEWVFGI